MALTVTEDTTTRTDFQANIDNTSANIKEMYDYFWMAKLKDNSKIAQFDKNGEEVLFSVVKTELEGDNVDSLSWIPFNDSLKTLTISVLAGDTAVKSLGMWRRGSLRNSGSGWKKTFDYVFAINRDSTDNFVFIASDGRWTNATSNNFDFADYLKNNP